MRIFLYFFILTFLWSCGSNTTDVNASNNVSKSNNFIVNFKSIDNTLIVADSNIGKFMEANISQTLLSNFVPDSALQSILKGDKKTSINPIGKIEKSDEKYALIKSVTNKIASVYVLVYDNEAKFICYKKLATFEAGEGLYNYSISINREPTFFVTQTKERLNREPLYTKTGFAFVSGGFVQVAKEGNESLFTEELINPIDAAIAMNELSGDYVTNERNILSVRDGKTKNEYQFYLHVEKDEGVCVGELKGIFVVADSGKAKYETGGDPCAIDFRFEEGKVTIKETGSCGNRRSLDCQFDELFTRKKSIQKKLPKSSIITTGTNADPIVAPKPQDKKNTTTSINNILQPNQSVAKPIDVKSKKVSKPKVVKKTPENTIINTTPLPAKPIIQKPKAKPIIDFAAKAKDKKLAPAIKKVDPAKANNKPIANSKEKAKPKEKPKPKKAAESNPYE